MKDIETMSTLTQGHFTKGKRGTDKAIKLVRGLADDSETARDECCNLDEPDALDNRDLFGLIEAEFRAAHAHLTRARSLAGGVKIKDRITRDGGT